MIRFSLHFTLLNISLCGHSIPQCVYTEYSAYRSKAMKRSMSISLSNCIFYVCMQHTEGSFIYNLFHRIHPYEMNEMYGKQTKYTCKSAFLFNGKTLIIFFFHCHLLYFICDFIN